MRKRPRPDQIASILRDFQADLDAGLNINQACRKAGIGPTTYYRWKALQEDPVSNEQLRMCRTRIRGRPTQALGRRAGARPPHAPGGLEKKAMTAPRRRLIVKELREQFHVSQRRASRALDLARSSLRYAPVLRDEQAALARRIEELAGRAPAVRLPADLGPLGSRGLVGQQEGGASHLASVGAEAGQAAGRPQAPPTAWAGRNACHLRPSRGKDDVWTWDFIFDRTSDGRSLKWLSLVDEYTRECLALEARRGMTAEDIRIILAEVAAGRGGPPCRLRSDNGPEFVAEVVRSWLEGTGSGPLYVAPGSPWQNGYAESFHSKVRDEFLDREEFESEPQARALGALWKEEYNTERPHSSLGYQTPAEFSATCERYVPIEEDPPDPSSTE